jgi:hypothetical protein
MKSQNIPYIHSQPSLPNPHPLVKQVIATAFAASLALFCAAADCDPGTNAYIRVAQGNGVIVKVARKAAVWLSHDGSNWVQQASGTRSLLYDVAFGNGVFVAVGNEGALTTSSNGACWVTRNARTDERLRGIAFGDGKFVAVGYEGTIITSKNGVRWTKRNSGTAERLQKVTYDAGKFDTVGWKGVVLTSSDGSRWKVRNPEMTKGLSEAALRQVISTANRATLVSTNGVMPRR